MKNTKIYTALIFLWIGFICAISFMEAYLKFKAEGVTLSIGLAIGSLVFNALNKVEITLALGLIVFACRNKTYTLKHIQILLIPVLILILQTLYLLPLLDERVQLIIQNQIPEQNRIHLIYIVLEVIKLLALIITGIKIIKYEHK